MAVELTPALPQTVYTPAPQANAPTTQAAPAQTGPADQGVSSRSVANTRLGQGWEQVASSSDYGQIFGDQSYVKNGADPQLLSLLQQAVDKAPELQGTQLAANVKSGRVGPEDVKQLQNFLQAKGYSVGAPGVDGKYGPLTHRALDGFLNGRPADGLAGQQAPAGQEPARGQSPRKQPPADGEGPAENGERPAENGERPANGNRQRTGPPEGYQAIRGRVPAGVTDKAKSLLGGEYGTETPFAIDGKRYVARVEQHYHPPGYQGGPNGWHKGITVYEQK
ncbi:MAG: peptidoglycan-binding protein [Armatimonadetes bacterium]|nr:peptidoglycan-binding protein [Armatimonadota bacterium]